MVKVKRQTQRGWLRSEANAARVRMERAIGKKNRSSRFDIGYELGCAHALEETLKRLKLNLWRADKAKDAT